MYVRIVDSEKTESLDDSVNFVSVFLLADSALLLVNL